MDEDDKPKLIKITERMTTLNSQTPLTPLVSWMLGRLATQTISTTEDPPNEETENIFWGDRSVLPSCSFDSFAKTLPAEFCWEGHYLPWDRHGSQ